MLLGFVLGPLMEENFPPRHADRPRRRDRVFHAPDLAVLLTTAIILLIVAALPKIRRRRDQVFVE